MQDLFEQATSREVLELRDYQRGDLEAVSRAMQAYKKIMYQLPTGGGKTKWCVQFAIEYSKSKQKHYNILPRVVIMSHRKEVQKQILADFETFAPKIVPEIMSPIRLYNIYQAKAYWNFSEHDLMIVDEAHHSPAKSWKTPIENFQGYVIGLTATPWRLSRTEGFDHIWQYLHCGPQIQWLIERKYLAEIKIKSPPSRDAIAGKGNAQGDFSMQQSYKYLNQREHINQHAIKWLLSHAVPEEKKSIAFCMTVEHAHNVAKSLTEKGYPAEALDAKTPEKLRDRIIGDFRQGKLLCLCNVFIASEGFDVPDAEIVCMLRPTKSLAMYLQMCGRATRPAEGKPYGLILDAAMNASQFGPPTDNRAWTLAPRGYGDAEGDAPTKKCDQCKEEAPAGVRKCYYCGYEFGKTCEGCKSWRSWKWFADTDGNCYDCEYDSARAFSIADGNGKIPHSLNGAIPEGERKDHQALVEAGFERKKYGSYQRYYKTIQITIMRSKFSNGYGYILRCNKTKQKAQQWNFPSLATALNGIRRRMFTLKKKGSAP